MAKVTSEITFIGSIWSRSGDEMHVIGRVIVRKKRGPANKKGETLPQFVVTRCSNAEVRLNTKLFSDL
jgi:hypothetical protein